ncbi:TonB family protein [Candidatus Dependentiae bacterium]|nr:TonB family protein [Candidatus Dependentiae bacterium]
MSQRYKKHKKLQAKKSKTGGIIIIGILLIIIIAGFSYFKFIYESPESINLRNDITEFKEEYDKAKFEWKDFLVAVNELKVLENDLNFITTYKEQRMNSSTVTEIRKKYSELRYKFDRLILDLPKVKNIPEDLKKLKAEVELYQEVIKKPGKREKEVLGFAKEKYLELENSLQTAKTISDLELIFLGMQEIKTKLVIFQTFLQIKKAEWKVELSNIESNILDAETLLKKLKDWIECYSKINNLWKELKAVIDTSKKISKREFNLENLKDLQKQNKIIENKFKTILKTVTKLAKDKVPPDIIVGDPPPPEPQDCVIVKPAVIKKTYSPEVPKSDIPDGKSSIVVIVNIVIKADGTPSAPKLQSSTGSEFLDETAKDAALKFEFEPAYCEDGRAAETGTQIPIQIKGK